MTVRIREPWLSFLRDVDRDLEQGIEVHCLGGFVLSALWDLPRPTGDIDFIEVRPVRAGNDLLRLAGAGSALAAKHHVHFQRVTIAEYPDGYETRLIDITPRGFRKLKLKALEAHDVVLAKLARNSPRDRADVEFLARKGVITRRHLQERFDAELRPNLLNSSREVLTLELWLGEFFEKREG